MCKWMPQIQAFDTANELTAKSAGVALGELQSWRELIEVNHHSMRKRGLKFALQNGGN